MPAKGEVGDQSGTHLRACRNFRRPVRGPSDSFVSLGENVAHEKDGLQRERRVYTNACKPVNACVGSGTHSGLRSGC